MGFAQNWQTLAALRAILGLFESALFPGAAFLISCWYPRKQMAVRNSCFFIFAGLIGSATTPLGYAFSLMHGRGGYSGWAWIFIMYGIITVVVGLFGYVFIVDFPDRATFLTEEQRQMILTRIQRDRSDAKPDPVTLAKVGSHLCDWKIWLYGYFLMSATVASYSLAYFLPVILGTMGFNHVQTMLLGTPTHLYALLPCLGSAWIADKYRNMRSVVIMFNAVGCLPGHADISSSSSPAPASTASSPCRPRAHATLASSSPSAAATPTCRSSSRGPRPPSAPSPSAPSRPRSWSRGAVSVASFPE